MNEWPPPPQCPHCDTKDSTEVVKPMENGCFLVACSSCTRPTIIDRHGMVLKRSDDVRG